MVCLDKKKEQTIWTFGGRLSNLDAITWSNTFILSASILSLFIMFF